MKNLIILILSATALWAGEHRPEHAYVLPGKIALEWILVDETRVWLSVNSINSRDWPSEGYHPSHTNVISHYKPIVRKLANGQWEITFSSSVTEDLP